MFDGSVRVPSLLGAIRSEYSESLTRRHEMWSFVMALWNLSESHRIQVLGELDYCRPLGLFEILNFECCRRSIRPDPLKVTNQASFTLRENLYLTNRLLCTHLPLTPPKLDPIQSRQWVDGSVGHMGHGHFLDGSRGSWVSIEQNPLNILEKRERGRIQGLPKVFKCPLSQKWVKLRTSNFVSTFIRSITTKAY